MTDVLFDYFAILQKSVFARVRVGFCEKRPGEEKNVPVLSRIPTGKRSFKKRSLFLPCNFSAMLLMLGSHISFCNVSSTPTEDFLDFLSMGKSNKASSLSSFSLLGIPSSFSFSDDDVNSNLF